MFRKLLKTDPNNVTLTILRLMLGVVFLAHGAQKVFGWFGGRGFSATMAGFTHGGIPAPLAFLAILAEFAGGLGLIVGLLSRVAAFGITCNMVVAIVLVHMRHGLFMNWAGNQKGEGIEYHLLVLAITCTIMIAGGGAYSVDAAVAGE